MDKHQPLRIGQRVRMGAGFFQRVAVQHHLSAKATRALDLHPRRKARHDDNGANPQPLRMVGHALRMVAGAHGDHAARALLGCQLRQLIASAALFKGGGELQVFKL